MPACLIANPAAGRGRGATLIPRATQAFAARGITDVRLTAAPGDEAHQIRAAVDDGFDTIAVLGGDGTWSKAAAELARLGSPARMALIAAGTGNDFVKNLPEPSRDIDAMARLVAGDFAERRIDMAAVDDQLFLNVAGFAFDVAVLERVERMRGWGGSAAYAIAALRELLAYRGLPAPSTAEGSGACSCWPSPTAPTSAAPSMWRRARASTTGCSTPSRFRTCRDPCGRGGVAARGTHLTHPYVRSHRAAGFTLRFLAPPVYEADGELRRAAGTEVRVESRPGMLRVVVPREAA